MRPPLETSATLQVDTRIRSSQIGCGFPIVRVGPVAQRLEQSTHNAWLQRYLTPARMPDKQRRNRSFPRSETRSFRRTVCAVGITKPNIPEPYDSCKKIKCGNLGSNTKRKNKLFLRRANIR